VSGWLLWVMLGCSSGGQEAFEAGIQATRGGEQRGAVEHFVQALEDGGRHPATYHGLGNALYRSGHIGESIAAWRRGMSLAPRNGDIAANLERAQRQCLDSIEPPQTHRPAFFWQSALSARESGLLSSAALAAGLVIAVVARIRRTRSGRKQPRRAAGWTAVMIALGALLGASTWDVLQQRNGAVVVVSQVAVRSTLGPEGVDLFVLHEGAQVGTSDQAQRHTLIALSDGRKGWVSSSALISTDPSRKFPLDSLPGR